MPKALWIAGTALLLSLAGCGSSDDDDATDGGADADSDADTDTDADAGDVDAGGDAGGDVTAPTIAFNGLEPFSALSATTAISVTAKDDTGVTLVELLANDAVVASSTAAPFDLSFDTTELGDGVVELGARATDAAGNAGDAAPVSVVVLNGGKIIELVEGKSGTMSVPEGYTSLEEVDVKHHWYDVDLDFSRSIVVLDWQVPDGGAAWHLSLSTGIGYCPDDGVVLGETVDGTAGPLVLDVSPEGGFPAGSQFFVHSSPLDAASHEGGSIDYAFLVFALN